MISVFTPAYNRAYRLPDLYRSLCSQTSRDFEWVIVDDGSTDNTSALVREWEAEAQFPIRYFSQSNGGKHRAINRGVREAAGELFFIVDSDDRLSPAAIETINRRWQTVKEDSSIGGVSGIRVSPDGAKIGGGNFDLIISDFLNIRYKEHITGDMAEVIRTDVMRQFPFPEIPGEKFCPEALVWNRIAQKYKMLYAYDGIYICEYLPDGLTAKITKVRMMSPIASMTHYSELSRFRIPLMEKAKAMTNFWRFWFCGNRNLAEALHRIGSAGLIFLPAGYLMHLRDKRIF